MTLCHCRTLPRFGSHDPLRPTTLKMNPGGAADTMAIDIQPQRKWTTLSFLRGICALTTLGSQQMSVKNSVWRQPVALCSLTYKEYDIQMEESELEVLFWRFPCRITHHFTMWHFRGQNLWHVWGFFFSLAFVCNQMILRVRITSRPCCCISEKELWVVWDESIFRP